MVGWLGRRWCGVHASPCDDQHDEARERNKCRQSAKQSPLPLITSSGFGALLRGLFLVVIHRSIYIELVDLFQTSQKACRSLSTATRVAIDLTQSTDTNLVIEGTPRTERMTNPLFPSVHCRCNALSDYKLIYIVVVAVVNAVDILQVAAPCSLSYPQRTTPP
jgi:hypothetical protein